MIGAGFVMLLLGAGAPSDAVVSIAADDPNLVVCGDDKGHWLALSNDAQMRFSYGDEQVLYNVDIAGGAQVDNDFTVNFVDPRMRRGLASVAVHAGACHLQCGERKTELPVLARERATALIAKATFRRTLNDRRAYALARDDRGVYYYVDRGRFADNRQSFRVFVGLKGDLKPVKLNNIVSDSQGDIFATPSGSLRLAVSATRSWWIAGSRKEELAVVPVRDNLPLIYNELGVYSGQRLGMPCDDF